MDNLEDPLEGCYMRDGGLFSLGWYLSWTPGDECATLDGMFTADELMEIARHMKHYDYMKTTDNRGY